MILASYLLPGAPAVTYITHTTSSLVRHFVPRGNSHLKTTGMLLVTLGRAEKAVLVPLRVFSLKKATAGALISRYLLG